MPFLNRTSRRSLIKTAAAFGGAAFLPTAAWPQTLSQRLTSYPFTLGVASGEVTPDGFVIWTRLAPRVLEPDGGMPPMPFEVRWEVAEDSKFGKILASGQAQAEPAWGHSVHVEVAGLRPNRPYWYRFHAASEVSAIGRARTAPAQNAGVDRLRICFGSCQNYETGLYGAYRHMVADDPDLILFLGDYIYEDEPGRRASVRKHLNPEPFDLAGYRVRYATYKADPLLQAAHAAAPWMTIWDDHEVANDYGNIQPEDDTDPAVFALRRAAAYQAFYEHMPLRPSARPTAAGMEMYRALNWGRLAQFQFIDDRQYRSLRACEAEAKGKSIPDCDERRAPDRSILGLAQETWLLDTLAQSRAGWNVLAQQTLFNPLMLRDAKAAEPTMLSRDGWDGFPATRDRIKARWQEANVPNPLVIGGDIHTFVAADVTAANGVTIASEFVGGSITSLGREAAAAKQVHADNPHLAVFDPSRRGYGRLDLTGARAEVSFRALANATDADSALVPDMTFVVENGRKGLMAG